MKVVTPKCDHCKKEFILGIKIAYVLLDDGTRLVVHQRCIRGLDE